MVDALKIADKVLAKVKSEILEMKKKYPNNSSFSTELNVLEERDGYEIVLGNYGSRDTLAKGLTRSDVSSIASHLRTKFSTLPQTKGWKNFSFECEDTCPSDSHWDCTYIKFPSTFVLLAEPCKEFVSLTNYIHKYGNANVGNLDLYTVGIGGKRGRVYGEEGDRRYLCHKPKRCENLLAELRKLRGTNDKVICKKKIFDDIDEWELQCSIRNEVEFNGVRHSQMEISVLTPSGKVKGVVVAS